MRTLAVVTVLVGLVCGQVPEVKPEDYGFIGGRVVNSVTKEPVRKATVKLRLAVKGVAELEVLTDGGGAFVAVQLMPGDYELSARATGYVGVLDDDAPAVKLGARGQKSDVVIQLVPQGVIMGRVLDEDGDAVADARVAAIPVRRRAGMGGRAGGETSANDLGEFRLRNLSPGTYLVMATVQRHRFGDDGVSPSAAPRAELTELKTFHPSTTDMASAVALTVPIGGELRAVDIRLRKTKPLRIAGRLEGFPAWSHLTVEVERLGASLTYEYLPGGHVQMDGTFEVRGVTSGQYVLHASMQRGKGNDPDDVVRGFVFVRVDDADVRDVVLTPRALVAVTGVVQGDLSEAERKKLGVVLQAEPDLQRVFRQLDAEVGADGRFALTSAARAPYRVFVHGLEGNRYLAAAAFGERDVLKNGMDVSGGGELTLRLGDDGGSVSGAVEMPKKGARRPGARILLWPSAEADRRPHRLHQSRLNEAGSFEITQVEPGRYKIIAIPFLEGDYDGLLTPSYLKAIENKADAVEVTARGVVKKDLKLASLSEFE